MNSLNDLKPGDSIYIYRAATLDPDNLVLCTLTNAWQTTVKYVDADYVILNKYWQCILVNCEEIIIYNG
jgi:hypothetical protein